MKLKLKQEITDRSLSYFLALLGAIILYFAITNLGTIFTSLGWFVQLMMPFVYGFVIAYLLKTPLKYVEKGMFWIKGKTGIKKDLKGLIRVISLVITMLLALALIIGFLSIVLPQLISSITLFISNLPEYLDNAQELLTEISQKAAFSSEFVNKSIEIWGQVVQKFSELMKTALPLAITTILTVSAQLVDIVVGIIVAIYFLLGKERFTAQIKKLMYALLPKSSANYLVEKARFTNKTFSKYISGQLTDAAVLGTICFIAMSIFNMPYAVLVSVIITVTNVIPIIGPFIGAIPSIFIISLVSLPSALGFALLILVLQQLDGNILVPLIVGESTGLSGFWVFLAIFIGGGLFGIVGVIVAVPTMAVLYSIIKELVENRLKRKSLSTETQDYLKN